MEFMIELLLFRPLHTESPPERKDLPCQQELYYHRVTPPASPYYVIPAFVLQIAPFSFLLQSFQTTTTPQATGFGPISANVALCLRLLNSHKRTPTPTSSSTANGPSLMATPNFTEL